jgi:hypothetical protein
MARKAKYANSGNFKVKNEIARQIMDEVANRRGRFLRKVLSEDELNNLGVPAGVDAWVIAEDAYCLEKTKQALREKDPVKTATVRENFENDPGQRLPEESDNATIHTIPPGQQLHSAMSLSRNRESVTLGSLLRAFPGAAFQQQMQPFENIIMNRQQFEEQQRLINNSLHSMFSPPRHNMYQHPAHNEELLNPDQQRLMDPHQLQTLIGPLLSTASLGSNRMQNHRVNSLLDTLQMPLQCLESLARFDSLQPQAFQRELVRQSLIDILLSRFPSTLQHPTEAGSLARINQSHSSHQYTSSLFLPSTNVPHFLTDQFFDCVLPVNTVIDRTHLLSSSASLTENNALRSTGFNENSKSSADESQQETKSCQQTQDIRSEGSRSSASPQQQKKRKVQCMVTRP